MFFLVSCFCQFYEELYWLVTWQLVFRGDPLTSLSWVFLVGGQVDSSGIFVGDAVLVSTVAMLRARIMGLLKILLSFFFLIRSRRSGSRRSGSSLFLSFVPF